MALYRDVISGRWLATSPRTTNLSASGQHHAGAKAASDKRSRELDQASWKRPTPVDYGHKVSACHSERELGP